MRTVTYTKNLYKFEELNEKAKEKAKDEYLNDVSRSWVFSDILNEDLEYMFPNSELSVEYSLAYCQGDGLRVNGFLDMCDVVNSFNKSFEAKFNAKQLKRIKHYFKAFGCFHITNRSRYSYFSENDYDIADQILLELIDYQHYRNVDRNLITEASDMVTSAMKEWCGEKEKSGYDFFYVISNEDFTELCESNEWEFDEFGNIA